MRFISASEFGDRFLLRPLNIDIAKFHRIRQLKRLNSRIRNPKVVIALSAHLQMNSNLKNACVLFGFCLEKDCVNLRANVALIT